MREIIFRGKRVDNGEWIEGGFVHSANGKRFYIGNMFECVEIVPETLGQYVGLDKNGTRIFEGDIISAYLDDISPESETRLLVCWHDFGWHGKTKYGYETLESDWVNYFKVIGNIHDNPELLERRKK